MPTSIDQWWKQISQANPVTHKIIIQKRFKHFVVHKDMFQIMPWLIFSESEFGPNVIFVDGLHTLFVTCIALCARQGCRIFSKCKMKSCTLVWFSTRSNTNTQPISACDISKERKQIPAQIYNLLFLSRGYTLRVIIEWIYCIVTFFAHCIAFKGRFCI